MNINKKNYTIVAKSLAKELIDDITGDNEDWLFGKKPSESVMIGKIDGGQQESSVLKGEDIDNQWLNSIPSIGLRFKVEKNCNSITFSLKGKLFYRVAPTYDDQCRYLVDRFSKKENTKFNSINEIEDFYETKKAEGEFTEPKASIVYIYKSIKLADLGEFTYDLSNWENSIDNINQIINDKLKSIINNIKNDSVFIKKGERSISTFYKKQSFEAFLNSSMNHADVNYNALPNWEFQVYSTLDEYDNYKEVLVQFINNTNKIAVEGSYETAVFNGGIIVKSNQKFIPYNFDDFKHYYADNPTLPAIGNNCTVVENGFVLETETVPIYEQKRVVTIDKYNKYVEFEKLINDPIPNLETISKEMETKLNFYNNEKNKIISSRMFDDDYITEFSKEIDSFKFEINRFKVGIELIKNKPNDVKKAFILMNKTFALNKKYVGWRLFQIVFIVSEIADIIFSEYKGTPGFEDVKNDIDSVDLIYFPTGGGKTETFLGCVIFAAFFDRLKGKEDGVTSIIKYPLRLLAAQQLDRILKLTINANIIKQENDIPGDIFTVGFFTGSNNTPNYIEEKDRQQIDGSSQEERNKLYRQIDYCPLCESLNKRSEMNVYFDDVTWRLKHKCSNTECGFEAPISIIDDEIYRFVPTFIISTIDKMANIGTSSGFKSILGQVKAKCPQHGYLSYSNRCKINHCSCEIQNDINRYDPVPTLFIQDELHLVNSSLGTFDSHYESLITYICSSLVSSTDRKTIKFIGATATIQNYINHIRGLYNKDAKMFPTSVRKSNFYSTIDEDDICRIIIGASLYGGSITYSVHQIVTLMRIIIANWLDNPESKINYLKSKGFTGDENDLKNILMYYLITIIYNNSKNDAGNVKATLENIGSNTLKGENVRDFDIAEISGDVDFKEIKNVMHNVESSDNKYETYNVIVATSAISHGVDEDCFNQIYFFGMPNQTAEYIQAYSRVGRSYTGLVFDIFRIVRDRDKSYIKNFYNFHEYKELLIDPVPINRYAKNAIYSTLPGIISALLYQHYVQSNKAIDVTKKINSNTLSLDILLNDVKKIYDCESRDSKLYEKIIEDVVSRIFNAFKSNTNAEIKIPDLIKANNPYHKGPMSNLRDVDIPLEISMKED